MELNGASLDFSCILSSYAENLAHEARCRYLDKLAVIEGIDPMRDIMFGEPTDKTLSVDACDLLSYLVIQTSFVTAKQFKARKGLEAYNQFVCRWIKDVSIRKIAEKYVVSSRVSIFSKLK